MSIANVKFTRVTSLRKFLEEMEIGESYVIPFRYYSEIRVRRCATGLKDNGYRYECSIKDSDSGTKVTRIK